jgi:hypothetical protein
MARVPRWHPRSPAFVTGESQTGGSAVVGGAEPTYHFTGMTTARQLGRFREITSLGTGVYRLAHNARRLDSPRLDRVEPKISLSLGRDLSTPKDCAWPETDLPTSALLTLHAPWTTPG